MTWSMENHYPRFEGISLKTLVGSIYIYILYYVCKEMVHVYKIRCIYMYMMYVYIYICKHKHIYILCTLAILKHYIVLQSSTHHTMHGTPQTTTTEDVHSTPSKGICQGAFECSSICKRIIFSVYHELLLMDKIPFPTTWDG